ncbi:MAG: T9SS type A sorting domain-containing protein [Bacteroidota bacterium]
MNKIIISFLLVFINMQINAQSTKKIITNYIVDSIGFSPLVSFQAGDTVPGVIGVDDIYSPEITLPFTFNFYGIPYNSMVIGENGFISFNISNAGLYCPWMFNASIPTDTLPRNSIFGTYQDISCQYHGAIRDTVIGISPARAFIVNFDSMEMFNCTSLDVTFQICLFENTDIIEVFILDKPGCSSWNNGNALLGVIDSSGTIGITPPGRNTGAWVTSQEAWRFSYGPVGISSIKDKELHIFPNPSDGNITVSMRGSPESATVIIYNSQGEIVLKDRFPRIEKNQVINVSDFPPGLYFLNLDGYSGKFVKQ